MEVKVKANDGRLITMSVDQLLTIKKLNETRKGGVASVKGYVPSTGWTTKPVQNIQFISHFSTQNLYNRKIESLKALSFDNVKAMTKDDVKLSALSESELLEVFNNRKAFEIATMTKTIDGNRNDAHRAAHDACYAMIGDTKVHLVTAKNEDKITRLVINSDGTLNINSIMVPMIPLNTTTTVLGVRKVVNSGNPVRMSNIIQKAINKRGTIYKTLSLKSDNFDSIQIDRNTFTPEDIKGLGDIVAA